MAYQSIALDMLAGKVESTPGTAEADSVSTAFGTYADVRLYDISLTPDFQIDGNYKPARGHHGRDQSNIGTQGYTVEAKCRICQSGTITVAPDWFRYANSCGAQNVTYAGTGIAIAPLYASDAVSMTLWGLAKDKVGTAGFVVKLAGAMGNMVIGVDGIDLVATFSMKAKYVSCEDVADVSAYKMSGMDETLSKKLIGTTATINSVTNQISDFQLDVGNTIEPVLDQSDTSGIKMYTIADRAPVLTCNPYRQLKATQDILTAATARTKFATTLAQSSPTAFEIYVPVGQLMNPGSGNREGVHNWDLSIECLTNDATDGDTDLAEESTWEMLFGARA